MNTRSILTLRLLLPIAVLLCVTAAFKNKEVKDEVANKPILLSDLYFKYTPSNANDYSPESVATPSNWSLIPANQACSQQSQDVACSFSISVAAEDESDFVDSGKLTSRANIQAEESDDDAAYVTDVMDSETSSSIKNNVANVIHP